MCVFSRSELQFTTTRRFNSTGECREQQASSSDRLQWQCASVASSAVSPPIMSEINHDHGSPGQLDRCVKCTGIPTPGEVWYDGPSHRVSCVDFRSGCASRYHHHCSSKNANTICSCSLATLLWAAFAAGRARKVQRDSPYPDSSFFFT